MDIGKESTPIRVRTANTVASFLLFALSTTGCNLNFQRGSVENPQDLLKYSTPVGPELGERYRQILTESIGRECELPRVEFRLIKRPTVFLPRFRTEGHLIPPLSEGETSSIIIPTLSKRDPVVAQAAKEAGVTREEYKKAQENVTIIHEGIHLCSPLETPDQKLPNPVIVDYTSPDLQRDRQGTYKLNYKVRRLEGETFTGLRLMVEESKVYPDKGVTIQQYQEEGDTEEFITHSITPQQVLKKYGADSLEYKVSQGEAYFTGRLVLTNIFAARGVGFSEIIGAKQKNDIKAIFEMIKQGFEEIGKRAGIEKRVTDENYANFVLFSFLTQLSTEKAAKDGINPNRLINYLSNYFFGKDFNITTFKEREQMVSVYNQVFTKR